MSLVLILTTRWRP